MESTSSTTLAYILAGVFLAVIIGSVIATLIDRARLRRIDNRIFKAVKEARRDFR